MPGYFQSGIFVYTSDSLPSTVKPDTAVQALYLPVSHSVYEPAGGAAGSLFVCLDPCQHESSRCPSCCSEVNEMMLGLSATEFLKLAKDYPMVPVWAEVVADLETPMSVACRLRQRGHMFVLESAEQGQKVGRYSFVCCDPLMVFESRGSRYLIVQDGNVTQGFSHDPLIALREAMQALRSPSIGGLPPLLGGCVGYVGYDYARLLEGVASQPELTRFPDILVAVPRCVMAFDHLRHTLTVVVNCRVDNGANEAHYESAILELRKLVSILKSNESTPLFSEPISQEKPSSRTFETYLRTAQSYVSASQSYRRTGHETPASSVGEVLADRESFERSVRAAKRCILNTEVSQVVLSRRVLIPIQSSALAVYRALRSINPSPYMFLLDFGHMQVVGASPEMLVRLNGRDVEVRPIAGTRRRGETAEEDQWLERDLLADAKERAEHSMLVDLSRDDLSRVCVPGTVRVQEQMRIERYSHVMHIVSSVKGELSPEYDQYDLLKATFPAGTVTGAPRAKAMKIIEEQELSRRGIYAGAVGYFGASGNMDMCIAIRTLVIADGVAQVQVGAGIVADSDATREYEETVNKAQAMNSAIELARSLERECVGLE
jgi:anthranilate synthase component 1